MQGSPVRFEFEDVSPVEKRLKVEIDKAQVNKKLDDSYRQLSRQVSLKGFRPGKAPRPLLESMYGKKVGSDAARELVNETIGDIIGQQTLRIISEPAIETLPDAQKDVPLRYSARIELMPQIELQDYEGIAISKREGKATDEQVNAELERRRQSHQELKPIEGRETAEAGDVLSIQLTGTLSHLTYKDKDMQVDLGKPEQSPIPGLAAALVGISLSATAHPIELTMPTEGLPKELGGKTGHFKVAVKAAHVKHVPALDDDFAKDTGEADSLEQLKDKIRASILEEDTEEARHEMRLALVDELLKRNPVPLPQGLIARLARNFLENERGRMQLQMRLLQDQRKENPDAKFTMPTPDQLVQAAQGEAVRNLSIEFVMMALADKEKVEVTEEDVEKHLAELAKERDKNVARVKAEIQREDAGLQQLRAQLRLEKALDVLESKAVISPKA
ncbi:MAG: trigger factor, partial [Deltaproteobacteria bacterium]|jgi:trigger factor|nr:trigger factor [Deltaproteobacteria bacterium]